MLRGFFDALNASVPRPVNSARNAGFTTAQLGEAEPAISRTPTQREAGPKAGLGRTIERSEHEVDSFGLSSQQESSEGVQVVHPSPGLRASEAMLS